MFAQGIENYLARAQELAKKKGDDPQAFEALLHLIDTERENALQEKTLTSFFQGEAEFYKGQYELALKHYLESRSIPHFEFYCYRSSAYVSKERGNLSKAKTFCKKALAIYPEDYMSLLLLDSLQEIEATQHPENSLEKETEELAGNFEQRPPEEDLFIADFKPSPPSMQRSETSMNTDANLFSFPRSGNPAATAALTQRLYHPSDEPSFSGSDIKSEEHVPTSPYDMNFMNSENELEVSLESFHRAQSSFVDQYLDQYTKRSPLPDHCLYILHGWNETEQEQKNNIPNDPTYISFFLVDSLRKTSGGYFLRWNQKGIVINPGKGFMRNFHRAGLHIRDIDAVIVTQGNPKAYADSKEIYDLNYRLNSTGKGLQVIHYYLNQKAYQELSSVLKPNFKQERDTVHCLELFQDSPDIEKVELYPGISMHYFSPSAHEGFSHNKIYSQEKSAKALSSLGVRFDLKLPSEYLSDKGRVKQTISLGYVSGNGWSPLIGHHLGPCDILIAGFGTTNSNDFNKESYLDDCLGFSGSYSLFEETSPKLMLCTEFSGREGDLRLEVVKKMRQLYSQSQRNHKQPGSVLPADIGLFVDLKTQQIRCSLTQALVDATSIQVVRSSPAFGRLNYLAPSCTL